MKTYLSALLRLAVFLVGMAAFMGEAHADRTINWVTLDGGASVTVAPGATISASINVTHDGGGSNNNWYSTGWRISTTPPGSITCVDTPNHGNNGTDTETFDITAPAIPGTYNAYFIAYRSDGTDCDAGSSTTYTLSNAVTVVVPTTVINTYYPATASAAAGSTSLTLGPATGASSPIASGDLLLVMQMQDATINANNTDAYGNGVSGDDIGTGATAVNGSGVYEYVVATNAVPLSGGTLSLPCGITNSYSHANATATSGQKRFQVIRVPVYASYTLVNTVTAQAWNGSTGGVLAFDVTGTLNLNSASISVDGLGFRGGATYTMGGTSGLAYTDYRTLASTNGNGGKGEGIAGTPRYVFTAPDTLTNTGAEGYPNGSRARGAPANAGGGATDRNPSANDQNPGGGGGANGGAGGTGGIGWCPTFNTTPPYYGCGYSSLVSAVNPNGGTGGFGGSAVPGLGAARLTLGGGGGAGTANNVTGSGACATVNGLCTSGAAGGGIIMIRAGAMTGNATFNANGSDGDSSSGNDGTGGGGAGGAVLISAASGMANVTINVNGGTGGSNLLPASGYSSNPHGPGGGGGGGYAVTQGAVAACNAAGGASGVTYRLGSYFGAYGATPGSAGSCTTTLTSAQIPGAGLGGTAACSSVHHFAISTGAGTASTCAPRTIGITAKDSSDVTLTTYTGTVTISTSSGHGDWAVNTANGTLNNGTADDGIAGYTFVAADNGAILLDLSNSHADDLTITVSDAAAGISSTSASLSFRDNVFVITPTSCTGASCPGTPSTEVVAVRPHGMQAALWTRDASSGLCAVNTLYAGSFNLKGWYSPDASHPAGASAPAIGATTLPTAVPAGNNILGLTFTNGVAPFTLNTSDVGKYTLSLRDDSSAFAKDVGGNPRPIEGSSSTLTVRPFALDIRNVRRPDDTANPGITNATGEVFVCAGCNFKGTIAATGWEAGDDVGNDGLPDSGANLNNNATTARYAWNSAIIAALPITPSGGHLGAMGNNSFAPADFGSGSATRTTLQYHEVGSVTLQTQAAANFLGTAGVAIPTASTVAGRFIPDHLDVVAINGQLQPSHGSNYLVDDFSYTGQAFTYAAGNRPGYTVTAKSADGTTTENYTGSFLRLATGSFTIAALSEDSTKLGADGLTKTHVTRTTVDTATLTDNTGGVATYNFGNDGLTYTREANALVAPYRTDVRLSLTALSDLDLVGGSSLPIVARPRDIEIRYGRVAIANAHGPELTDLHAPMLAQHYDGTTFITNTLDNATSTSGALVLTDRTGTLIASGATCVQDTGTPGLSGAGCATAAPAGEAFALPPVAGDFNLWFMAPGAGTTGSFDVTAPVPAWLRYPWGGAGDVNPTGRITFGIYKGSPRHIYLRERY